MEPRKLVDCLNCIHLDEKNLVVGFYCKAFPDGIPDAIISGKVKHNKPFRGDHGIQFEARPEPEDNFNE